MSEKGDKVCPLCTEEMDLTDKQLKPCKCGYEICVWCWNHIMEMAEKDNSEGRCPACRTSYDKERIVGMAANCERLVAEINSERKLKLQKAKPKPSEGRMHLSNVRVIQRNLVYIIGLPLNLADEALLQQKDYFGQYGKVLKVSISRTATGVIQHSSNNSCCVYIAYSKEEEAVRCIQSVHSYVLEGRTLRACFGTTKYCHSWLKNMPCSIPDCLYLHEFGAQEDSFTKDDLVTAFTRSRVQQTIGATNNLHRRSGDVLPSPADEHTDGNKSSMAKLESKIYLNDSGNSNSGSCADSIAERSYAFPGAASWVKCVSSGVPPATSLSASGSTLCYKPQSSVPQVFASDIASPKKFLDVRTTVIPARSCEMNPTLMSSSDVATPSAVKSSLGLNKPSSPALHEDENFHADGDFQGICSALSSFSIVSHLEDENSNPVVPETLIYDYNLPVGQGAQLHVNSLIESSASALRKSSIVEDLLGFDDQQLKASRDTHNLPSMPCLHSSKQNLVPSGYHSWNLCEINHQMAIDAHPRTIPNKCDAAAAFLVRPGKPELSNRFCNNQPSGCLEFNVTSNSSNVMSNVGFGKQLVVCDNTEASANNKVGLDIGESSIISSILSMDLDAWEDTLTSPQSLAKLLTEADKKHGSLKVPSIRKVQGSSQSKFSFARQDDFFNQEFNVGHSLANGINNSYATRHCNENKDLCIETHHEISSNGSSVITNSFPSSHTLSVSKFSVPKAPTSPPPGFSLPSRSLSPGFPTHAAVNPDANHFRQNSALSPRSIGGSFNVGYIDPPITEVGNSILAARLNNLSCDMSPALSPRLSPFNHDTELQMLMQQPISVKQNPRTPDHFRNRFSPPNDAYNISSMLLGQSPPSNLSPFAQLTTQQVRNMHMSHGHLRGWDEIKSVNNMGMSELFINGRLGPNNIIPNHEDLKHQMSSSSNLYNREFAL